VQVRHALGVPRRVDRIGLQFQPVERGKAPDMMIGEHPNEAGGTDFARPIYAYPLVATYVGSGDPKSPQSFKGAPTTK
jgi:hypothetical protein